MEIMQFFKDYGDVIGAIVVIAMMFQKMKSKYEEQDRRLNEQDRKIEKVTDNYRNDVKAVHERLDSIFELLAK